MGNLQFANTYFTMAGDQRVFPQTISIRRNRLVTAFLCGGGLCNLCHVAL